MNSAKWIAGKSIEEILNMPLRDVEKLTESQLRTLVGRGVSAGNKRLRRFQEKRGELPMVGSNTPFGRMPKNEGQLLKTLGSFKPSGKTKPMTYEEMKFSTVGKDRQELMEEYKRIRSFMRAETSSLRGYSKVKRKAITELKNRTGIDLTSTNYDRFWKAYERLKEVHPEVANSNYKYNILKEMEKMVEGKKRFSIDKLVRDMERKLTEIYEEQEGVQNGFGTSGFFEV